MVSLLSISGGPSRRHTAVKSSSYDVLLRLDVQTSDFTTINETKEGLNEMADIVGEARSRSESSSWCLGRFMLKLTNDRFVNYHGQYGARLNHSQSIYKREKPKRTWLIRLLSPLLFSAPNIHLKSLEGLWTDRVTLKLRCTNFFVKMNTQWGEHLVHASILLNANVGFLSIASNDPSSHSPIFLSARTAAQIASYISTTASFGSMMLALLLVREHNLAKEGDFETVQTNIYHQYMQRHDTTKHGFEALAIIYSLPYALLTWGMGTFLVAFMLMCFVKSTPTVHAILTITFALICGLIVWCICIFRENTKFQWQNWFKVAQKIAEKEKDVSTAESSNSATTVTTHEPQILTAQNFNMATTVHEPAIETVQQPLPTTQGSLLGRLTTHIAHWRSGRVEKGVPTAEGSNYEMTAITHEPQIATAQGLNVTTTTHEPAIATAQQPLPTTQGSLLGRLTTHIARWRSGRARNPSITGRGLTWYNAKLRVIEGGEMRNWKGYSVVLGKGSPVRGGLRSIRHPVPMTVIENVSFFVPWFEVERGRVEVGSAG
ncbi:hypothetical protein DXG01_012057 [Tephrocybe rancida]|nr:hypothetical protein DXG01_012057 [Tephrocybe rancida]